MLDFLDGYGTGTRLIVLSCGVGLPREVEMIMAQDALEQKVPCAIYTLNLRVPRAQRRRAAALGVRIQEYTVFHDLLQDMLEAAGLPGPARELAAMHDDGTRSIPAAESHPAASPARR